MHKLKNLLLQYPADWFIDPTTLEKAKKSLPDIIEFYKGTKDLAKLPLADIIKEPLKDVYTVPFLSEKFCKILLDEVKHMESKYDFTPNPDEDELRQIPEIVFGKYCPELAGSLMEVVANVANPIFLNIWNRYVTVGNIQVANYNLKKKKQGAWHHDASSMHRGLPVQSGDRYLLVFWLNNDE